MAYQHLTLFPNFSIYAGVDTARIWHPRGPDEIERASIRAEPLDRICERLQRRRQRLQVHRRLESLLGLLQRFMVAREEQGETGGLNFASMAKSIDVARLVLANQPGGITVSTLAEAEYFSAHGITDILYAVGVTPRKLADIASLNADGAKVMVITDDIDTAGIIAA